MQNVENDEIAQLKKILGTAIGKMYAEETPLPKKEGMEQAIVFRVAVYMNELLKSSAFKELHLDCEYNKCMDDPKTTPNFKEGLRPDLLIHKRGDHSGNKLAVEFKGWWQKDFDRDKRKLKDLVNREYDYKYVLGAFVLIGKDKPEIEYFTG